MVKIKVKPGAEAAFVDAHRDGKARWPARNGRGVTDAVSGEAVLAL